MQEERLPGPQESWQLAWFPEKYVLVGSFYNESQELFGKLFSLVPPAQHHPCDGLRGKQGGYRLV